MTQEERFSPNNLKLMAAYIISKHELFTNIWEKENTKGER